MTAATDSMGVAVLKACESGGPPPTSRASCLLSREVLQTCPETLKLLRDRGTPVLVVETREAVVLYNELAEHHAVGGLFHSTC